MWELLWGVHCELQALHYVTQGPAPEKDADNALVSDLTIDTWKVVHEDDPESGENFIVEEYEGQKPMERTGEQKYLGFILSNKGDNLANIRNMQKKSKGIIRTIFNKLNNLKLGRYYFECALVFMKSMLRSSILFACETYYNLKDSEIKQLESIEENFLRELFKTPRSCPIAQLYLEGGLIPAKFEIIKIRLLFLKNILGQNENCMLFKFFKLQLESSAKGDWTTECLKNLSELKIEESLESISKMTDFQFKNLLNKKIKENAFLYLIGKQGKKGGDIRYSEIQMTEYLQPNSKIHSNEMKRDIFALRNKMVKIPGNFASSEEKQFFCKCGESENTKHLYECKVINSEEPVIKFEEIYSNNIQSIYEVNRRFQQNMNLREEIMKEIENEKNQNPHVIVLNDPLYSLYRNG